MDGIRAIVAFLACAGLALVIGPATIEGEYDRPELKPGDLALHWTFDAGGSGTVTVSRGADVLNRFAFTWKYRRAVPSLHHDDFHDRYAIAAHALTFSDVRELDGNAPYVVMPFDDGEIAVVECRGDVCLIRGGAFYRLRKAK